MLPLKVNVVYLSKGQVLLQVAVKVSIEEFALTKVIVVEISSTLQSNNISNFFFISIAPFLPFLRCG
jgi:hypothetical protein